MKIEGFLNRGIWGRGGITRAILWAILQWILIRQVGMDRSTSLGISLAIILGTFPETMRSKAARSQSWILAIVISIVGGFELWRLWTGSFVNHGVLGTILPWSDPSEYYIGARSMVEFGQLTEWNGRRPLFSAFLSVLLKVTCGNLRVSILLLVGSVLAGIWFFSIEVGKRFGLSGSLYTVIVLLSFYFPQLGATSSENLGLLLGCLGLGLLLRSAKNAESATAGMGTCLLTLGLCARAGAFLVLPSLLIWAIYRGWEETRSLRFGLAVILGVFCGYGVNLLFSSSFCIETSGAFSNLSYTLYGLAAGGRGWKYVADEFPQLFTSGLGDAEVSRQIMAMAIQLILEKPGQFLEGLWKSFEYYTYYGAIADFWPRAAAVSIVLVPGLVAIILILNKRRDPLYGLPLAIFVGVLTSVPVLAADGGSRVFAATFPMTAALPAYLFPRTSLEVAEGTRKNARFLLTWGLSLFLFVASPFAVKYLASKKAISGNPCSPGQDSAVLRVFSGSFVTISEGIAESSVPHVKIDQSVFHRSLPELYHFRSYFFPIAEGSTIINGFDLLRKSQVWVILNEPIPSRVSVGSLIGVCGRFKANPNRTVNFLESASLGDADNIR